MHHSQSGIWKIKEACWPASPYTEPSDWENQGRHESLTASGCLSRENRLQRQVQQASNCCSRFQGEVPGFYKKTWVEKGIFVFKFIKQRHVAGEPGQIFEIGAGGDGWLVPWVKEKET